MKKILGVAALGIALTACGVNGTTNTATEEYTENCVNTSTGEIIDPGYCYSNVADTSLYYYPNPLPYGQFIEIDNNRKSKPKIGIVKTYQPKSTPLPKYVPATRPVIPAPTAPKPPVYTPPPTAKVPAYTPAPMPTVQQNKPAAPIATVAKPVVPPAPMPKPVPPAPKKAKR